MRRLLCPRRRASEIFLCPRSWAQGGSTFIPPTVQWGEQIASSPFCNFKGMLQELACETCRSVIDIKDDALSPFQTRMGNNSAQSVSNTPTNTERGVLARSRRYHAMLLRTTPRNFAWVLKQTQTAEL